MRDPTSPTSARSPRGVRKIAITSASSFHPRTRPICRISVNEDAALYGWEFAVDDIAAVMRGLAIERAHVVGLSMGG